jgi:hypothetical protein
VGQDIQKHLKDNSASMHSQPLKPFEGLEADLAYSQYLLTLIPPLTANSGSAHRKQVEDFYKTLRTMTKGIPSYLTPSLLQSLIFFTMAQNVNLLVEANDAVILANAGGI